MRCPYHRGCYRPRSLRSLVSRIEQQLGQLCNWDNEATWWDSSIAFIPLARYEYVDGAVAISHII